MAGRIYVALDLETTGLDANRDTIIEIGAVRFQDNTILDRYVTLVNPRRPIPPRITQITGLRDADVARAPDLATVLPELISFVTPDVAAVVAHNAAFDLGFLRAAGVNFQRPALDTYELATILLPGQGSYSLGELCHALGVPLVEAHRALDDAEATGNLFMRLAQRVEELDPSVLQAITLAAGESHWSPLLLFGEAAARTAFQGGRQSQQPLFLDPGDAPESLLTDNGPPPTPITAERVSAFFAPGGPMARLLGAGYEARPGQVEMAVRTADALSRGDHLMVEAGTGTGKSLAYLLPAALWAVQNQRRVVIATNTIALQDQLLDKDIPQTQAILAEGGLPAPNAALLKGRSNYLCLRRLNLWRASHRLSPAELSVLARVLVWLPTTRTGDVNELAMPSSTDKEVWQQICSESATCSPERCGIHAPGGAFDFFDLARRRAENAHLLVVNHALLLADLATQGRVLPPYTHLVVDEAHRLEEAATDALTYRVEWPWVQALLRRLSRDGDLAADVQRQAARLRAAQVEARAADVSSVAELASNRFRAFLDHLLAFGQQQAEPRDGNYVSRIALDSKVRSQPMWSEVEIDWEQAAEPLDTLLGRLETLVDAVRAERWGDGEPTATLFNELQGAYARLSELAAQMVQMIDAPGGSSQINRVTWLEIGEQRSPAALASAPLHVSDILQRDLLFQRRSAVFTGATLRTGANFRFIRERLGLWDVSAAIVDSPFDYKRSTLLYMPSDLPPVNQPAWQQGVERAIIEAADACAGRTLVLFTSNAHLRSTADGVRGHLERLGISVLQQGATSRQRLLRDYRTAERAVLLGTRSFWEGIDLPGDELRCLVIAKLPFAVPNDPLVAARSAECDDSFSDFMLPDAILRFRQGFGRLIRRASDRGVVVLLDNRIWKRDYGQAFLDALPPCTTRRAPLSLLASEVRSWLP